MTDPQIEINVLADRLEEIARITVAVNDGTAEEMATALDRIFDIAADLIPKATRDWDDLIEALGPGWSVTVEKYQVILTPYESVRIRVYDPNRSEVIYQKMPVDEPLLPLIARIEKLR